MNIKVNSDNLVKGLKTAFKAIPTKAAIPILESFKMDVKGNRLVITSSNGELTVKAPVMLNEPAEADAVTVPARRFMEFINLLPSCEVEIETNGKTMTIKWSKGSTQMQLTEAKDYPAIAEPTDSPMVIPAQELLSALMTTIPAASRDNSRQVLNGIHFDIGKEVTRLVATDTKMLTYDTISCGSDKEMKLTIPTAAAMLLKAAIHKDSTIARLTFDANNACFNFGDVIIMTRLLVGAYPKYMTIIPGKNDIKGQVFTGKENIIGTLKRLASCSGKLKMKLSPLAITFTAQNTDTGTSAVEDCDCNYCGEEMEIGINPANLLSILENIPGDQISMEVSNPRKPILASRAEEGEKDLLSLCMPIAIA